MLEERLLYNFLLQNLASAAGLKTTGREIIPFTIFHQLSPCLTTPTTTVRQKMSRRVKKSCLVKPDERKRSIDTIEHHRAYLEIHICVYIQN